MTRRIEVRRNDDGSIDEVLLYDADECLFHMEQTGKASWYFGLYPNGVSDDLEQFWVHRDGKRVIVRASRDAG